jgi:hypothetical protein
MAIEPDVKKLIDDVGTVVSTIVSGQTEDQTRLQILNGQG